MLRRLPPAVFVATSGLALTACQKSIAQDPPCPPGAMCEDPIELWPILGPIGGGLVAIAIAVGVVVRPRDGQPTFVPDRRSLRVSLLLALVAVFLLAASAHVPILFGWLQWGALVAAFVLGGTGLRPRGSRLRGLILGVVVYLIPGAVLVLIVNQGFIGNMDVLAWLIQVPSWPGLMFLYLGQFLG